MGNLLIPESAKSLKSTEATSSGTIWAQADVVMGYLKIPSDLEKGCRSKTCVAPQFQAS